MTDWIAASWPAPDNIVAGTTTRLTEEGDLPLDGEPCWLNQVHGSEVVVAKGYSTPPDADASVSADDGHICVVRTADCLPVLICSVDGTRYAAAHAGWRGLAAGVVENTIEKLGSNPQELLVWLGPAISQASFEVGDEVRQAFIDVDADSASCFAPNSRNRWQADLYGLARRRLQLAGVRQVFGGEYCTYIDDTRFYSYRRNPDCGRMVSFIGRNMPKNSP